LQVILTIVLGRKPLWFQNKSVHFTKYSVLEEIRLMFLAVASFCAYRRLVLSIFKSACFCLIRYCHLQ